MAGRHNVAQNPIHGILVENADIPVRLEIHLQGFQFQTQLVGNVFDGDGSEIRQPGFRADRGVFGHFDRDFVVGKLILPAFDVGESGIDAAFGVVFGVLAHTVILIEKPSGASYSRGPFT